MRRLLYSLLALFLFSPLSAQRADLGKMSSMLRALAMEQRVTQRRAPMAWHPDERLLCAFVRVDGDGERLLSALGCRSLARFGDIHVATIPLSRLSALSMCHEVRRIEASRGLSVHMDTTLAVLGATQAHRGAAPLPQAFTGSGVVVGVMDIGFDLTHPNFYDATATRYRIRRLWDFLSTDTVGSECVVGADYTTEQALLAYAHSRDGLIQSHGTHTLGSAAGSGYDTPYRGVAPGSDICLVSNVVSDDIALVDSADIYKFTYATDALGFKYMFDYADAQGMPCVVSFSEGSPMDFRGDDQLYYEVLDSLSSRPGHVMVASAGNAGQQVTHVSKAAGVPSASVQLISGSPSAVFAVKSRGSYTVRLHLTGGDGQVAHYDFTPQAVLDSPDSLLSDTLVAGGQQYVVMAAAYPSCFDESDLVVEAMVKTEGELGLDRLVTMDVEGEAAVDLFRSSGYVVPIAPTIGDNAYSVHSPSSAPGVICVGATGYRTGFVNYRGEYHSYDQGTDGERSAYSSVGPTYDGRVKPDVMAPGTNVISSYSSYYLEAQPEASDIDSDVAHFDFRGRTYAWNANSGTSMSAPVVAGAVALWLEANPRLSTADVMEVIRRTSRRPDPSLQYPNNLYGYGEIDIYAGLLDVLGISGVDELSHRQPDGVTFALVRERELRVEGDRLGNRPLTLRFFSVDGTLVHVVRGRAVDGCLSVSLSAMPRGVYAIQLDAPTVSGSTLVRLD